MIAINFRKFAFFILTSIGSVACLPDPANRDVFKFDEKLVKYQFGLGFQPEVSPQELANILLELNKKPASVRALNELAASYLKLARSNGSLENFTIAENLAFRSLKLNSVSNDEAQVLIARVADAKHQFQRAIEISEKIVESNPNHFGARQLLITSYIGMGQPNRALKHSEYLLRKIPVDSSQLLHAMTLEQIGRDDEAVFYFTRSFELEDLGDPDGAAWKRMITARFFLKHGKFDLATALTKSGMEISQLYQAMAYESLGNISFAKGKWSEAEQHYQVAFKTSRRPNFLNARSRALELDGRTADAIELRNLAFIQMSNDSGELGHRRDLIELLIDRGGAEDFAAAAGYAEAELNSRTDYRTYLQLSQALLGQGDSARAKSTLNLALASGFRHPEIYFVASQIYRSTGEPAKAKHYLKLAELMAPGTIQPANFKKIFPQTTVSTRL